MSKKRLRTAILTCCLTLFVAQSALAQSSGPRKQLATIIYSGLGGAILGLSTLSFYGRPQEKLSNIAIGFAFGVIAGTVVVTYQAATRPNDFYGGPSLLPDETLQISTQMRHDSQRPESQLARFSYQWSF